MTSVTEKLGELLKAPVGTINRLRNIVLLWLDANDAMGFGLCDGGGG